MGQIYYDFVQGLNFIGPNEFNTTIFWDEITIRMKETNLTLTLLRIVDRFKNSRRRYHLVWN